MSDDCYIEFISHEYDLRENRFIIPHPKTETLRGKNKDKKNILLENIHLFVFAPTREVTQTLEWEYKTKSPLKHTVNHNYTALRCKSTTPDYLDFLRLGKDDLAKLYNVYDALMCNGIHCGIETIKGIPYFCLYQFKARLTAWPLNPIKLAWLTYIY